VCSSDLTPDHVGNGCHIHMSLADANGINVTHDPNGALGLSKTAAYFCAGILEHMDALIALIAPSPVSYYRLGPHHWSTGYRAIGFQNREAAVRIMPGIARDAARAAKSFNIEIRASDATASPYLALGALLRAGLDGIQRKLSLPPAATIDPAAMTEAERGAAGMTPLPASLKDALACLERDEIARAWFSDELYETYTSIKRWESEFAETNENEHVFARYRRAY